MAPGARQLTAETQQVGAGAKTDLDFITTPPQRYPLLPDPCRLRHAELRRRAPSM